MKDVQTRLVDLWLRAMQPGNGLPSPVRQHLEWVLGNEYRMHAVRTSMTQTAHDHAAA